MTSSESNDLMPAQEKLEWVTPKISLMDAGETGGNAKIINLSNEVRCTPYGRICGAS